MIWLNFEIWNRSVSRRLVQTRWWFRGYMWTPIVFVWWRKGPIPWKDDGDPYDPSMPDEVSMPDWLARRYN